VTVTLSLKSWIPQLEPILVTAPARSLREQEMFERHRRGFGTLILHERLREREHVRLDDVLKEAGVKVVYGGFNRQYAVSPRIKRVSPSGARDCVMQVYLNGVQVENDLGQYPIFGLGAVEVFKSGVSAPIQYSGLDRGCGVVLLWTRER
jgi:hypothetical protein